LELGYYGSKDGGGYGNYVLIEHSDGYSTLYGHMLRGTITVSTGDTVEQGQVIGKMGTSGSSTGIHLHFEVRDPNGNKVDPELYVDMNNPKPLGGFGGVLVGDTVKDQIWFYLVGRGMTAEQVAGIMGNIQGESGFQANVLEKPSSPNKGGYGLAQWTGGRRIQLRNFAGGEPCDVKTQLDFLWLETIKGEAERSGRDVNFQWNRGQYEVFATATVPGIGSVGRATEAFYYGWERPKSSNVRGSTAYRKSLRSRTLAAEGIYNEYKGKVLPTTLGGISEGGNPGTTGSAQIVFNGQITDVTTYTSNKTGRTYAMYRQGGQPWSSLRAGSGTISKRGCLISAMSSIMTGYGINITPGQLAYTNGVDVAGTFKQYGLNCVGVSQSQIKEQLRSGKEILFRVWGKGNGGSSSFTSSQHYMALIDIDETRRQSLCL
jgi:hypothetical protein